MKQSIPPAGPAIHYGYEHIAPLDLKIFYREVGPADAPTVLLLHGFPASSHQYRGLMSRLGAELHLVALDYPGFGFSDAPKSATEGGSFTYTFDRLTDVVEAFCIQRGIQQFVVYLFDFGAPVGFRLALRHPDWIQGIITQNGNAYTEGIAADVLEMIRVDARREPEKALAMRGGILTLEATKGQYLTGAAQPELVPPEAWFLDYASMEQPNRKEAMLSLLDDYKTNLDAYPLWQRFLRERQPPTLIVWGKNDPIFLAAGARAWLRDVPHAELHLLDGGHFLLEDQAASVAPLVSHFVSKNAR